MVCNMAGQVSDVIMRRLCSVHTSNDIFDAGGLGEHFKNKLWRPEWSSLFHREILCEEANAGARHARH